MTTTTQTGRPGRISGTGTILLMALSAALVTATLQLIVRGGRVLVLGRLEVVSPDSIWMAPIAESGFFLLVALPFLLLTLLRPARVVTLLAVFVFTALACFLAGLQTRWMYQWACLALAIGAGWRLASYWRHHPERAWVNARRASTSLAALFGIGTAIELFVTADRGPTHPAPGPDAPNVILLILDTVGARHLSLHGYHRETSPHLARVASEGVSFENAIAPSSWTLPSHASLFTGVPAYELTTRFGIGLDDSRPTLAERFSERGYRTAGFTANITYTGQSTGLSRGFQFYRGEVRTPGTVARQASFVRTRLFRRLRDGGPRALLRTLPDFTMDWETPRVMKDAGMIVREFLGWQPSATDRPFFAFLNFYDAHFPYRPPREYATRFAGEPQAVDRYDGGVAYMDAQLGMLVEQLRQRQLLDRTIFVIAADHGEAFGEHGLTGHGNTPRDPLSGHGAARPADPINRLAD
jgi:phosphoglycerol transferase MdoB-like AlkP superfamily enzyme